MTGKSRWDAAATLLELIIATVAATLLSTGVFTSYLVIHKQFTISTKRGFDTFQRLSDKYAMEKATRAIAVVHSIGPGRCGYLSSDRATAGSISLIKTEIRSGETTIVGNVKSFTVSTVDGGDPHGKKYLLWDIDFLDGSWIGGAFEAEVALERP